MQESQFFTWEALRAIGGASLATFFLVQFSKKLLDRFLNVPTDILAVFFAFVVLVISQVNGTNWTDWRLYALNFLNSFLVAAAAAQIQQKAIKPPEPKQKGGNT
ncbi:hypothetical protein [Paenibacillus elgii]|uniref:hypothetical protein n=1 Tax=Paenibacillus elgii TaxID=189691 RepID=UPI00203DC0FD|nr:hypothetical protein [Paenibacillus elgii]MCM3272624.1 hypothetical protein [Paenibacillus elgii]